jgi:acetamidase/formamidase
LPAATRFPNVIDLLQEGGWSCEQAYLLCCVAASLRIRDVVDVPNYVSALNPEAIYAR